MAWMHPCPMSQLVALRFAVVRTSAYHEGAPSRRRCVDVLVPENVMFPVEALMVTLARFLRVVALPFDAEKFPAAIVRL